MNLLFTGRRNAGSWQIRGVQLAAAVRAPAITAPTLADCRSADVIVVVKKADPDLLKTIRDSRRPWVYDIVDVYNQSCFMWSKDEAVRWVREHVNDMHPHAVIWPNAQMQKDCGAGLTGFVLPHHARQFSVANPIRKKLQVIGYEGDHRYLGPWEAALHVAARAVGAKFTSYITDLAACDVVVAVRGGKYANYCTRNWKSGVKLTNAQATGTPFIGQAEAGYVEQASGVERFVESHAELIPALERLAPYDVRIGIHDLFRTHAQYATPQRAGRTLIDNLQSLGIAA